MAREKGDQLTTIDIGVKVLGRGRVWGEINGARRDKEIWRGRAVNHDPAPSSSFCMSFNNLATSIIACTDPDLALV